MGEYKHPLRDAQVRVFKEVDEPDSYRAVVGRDGEFPIYFAGASYEEVFWMAHDWRNVQADSHEAAYVARRKAAEKARATKVKKAA